MKDFIYYLLTENITISLFCLFCYIIHTEITIKYCNQFYFIYILTYFFPKCVIYININLIRKLFLYFIIPLVIKKHFLQFQHFLLVSKKLTIGIHTINA